MRSSTFSRLRVAAKGRPVDFSVSVSGLERRSRAASTTSPRSETAPGPIIGNTVVKIQRPLAGDPKFRIYNRDRSINYLWDYATELADLFIDGVPKVYHRAQLRTDGVLEINERIANQEW